MRRHARFLALALVIGVLAGCSSSGESPTSKRQLVNAVNAPFSVSPVIGRLVYQGTQLGVDEINAQGGVDIAGTRYKLRVEKLDNALSPKKALDNVRQAVADKVVAIVDEGTGVDASWQVANAAHIPIAITYEGGEGLVDSETRPNVFRIAPTDHGITFRLAEYLAPKGLKVAFVHDDSTYGQQGVVAFHDAWDSIPESVAADVAVPFNAQDVSPQMLQARRSGATALLVWAQSSTIAKVLRTVRGSGWDVPVYTAASGADPLIRQSLSDHPEWVDGLTFASGRMTAERGPAPFLRFQRTYVQAFGPDEVGVKTSSGEDVVQPPEFAMYSYDFVHVLAAALTAAHSTDGGAILTALNQVDVRGANGDERGFNEKNHEGVVDDDVYFAVFHDMTYTPVQDDPLSSTLQTIDQTP
jgi:ABC-type branched-subunit amino acid transport system substrate-binding protein